MRSMQKWGIGGRRAKWGAATCAVAALVLTAAGTAAAAPTVSVTGVTSGATVAPASLTLGAIASTGTTQVKWYLDGQEVGWDGTAPWEVSVASTKLTAGSHTVFAKAADAANTWGTSAVASFTVANPQPAVAEVAVTAPAAASTVSGTVELTARASDPAGIRQMKWYVDGQEVAWDGAAPWQATWSSARVLDGPHTVTARAENGSGVWLNSTGVQVTVANSTLARPLPDSPTVPTTDLPGWRLLMADDFDGSVVDTTKWRIYGPNWSGHAGNGLRDGRAVSIQNGKLTITAQMLNGVLVSGGLKARVSQAYGRYSFRARVDADPSGATTGCVLTWPTSENWPAGGENNIWETTTPSRYPFSTFIHYSPQNYQYWFHHYSDGTQWHDMAMEWEPNEIRIYRNGVQVFKVNDTYAIPDWPHNLVLQLDAVKPWMSGVVRMEVDNVRIYAKA
jgi:hypothetical protein